MKHIRIRTSDPSKNLLNSIVYDLGTTKCFITVLIDDRMKGDTPGKVITSIESDDNGLATISIAGNCSLGELFETIPKKTKRAVSQVQG